MNNKTKGLDFESLALQVVETIKRYPRLLIYIKGSPDPDAIAGSYALKLLCEAHGAEASIYSPKEPSLAPNIKLIKELQLPIRFKDVQNCRKNFDAYAVMDHQSVNVEGITGVIPCAFHFDHHEPVSEDIPVDLRIHTTTAGSTSTIIIPLLQQMEIDFDEPRWKDAATAFYYGIQTDTDDFQHATRMDYRALVVISPYADKGLLDRISALPFTKETVQFFHKALVNHIVYKNWLISGIGYIDEKHRDNIGIIADFLLKREGIDVVVTFGIVTKANKLVLDASFRTKDAGLNLNSIIKKITRNGGARKYKGAYQVDLDYFAHCPDKDMLWQTVYDTTVETLKKSHDEAHANELKKLFSAVKRKFTGLFKQ
jgi:nanoRNase/pAp phosphatase (c-di-AMP/oligoRNAs hydrolase)